MVCGEVEVELEVVVLQQAAGQGRMLGVVVEIV